MPRSCRFPNSVIRPRVDSELSDHAFPGGSAGFTELDFCHCFSLAFSPSTKNDPAALLKSVVPFPPRQERSLADCYKMQINPWLTQRARCRPALPQADYLGA